MAEQAGFGMIWSDREDSFSCVEVHLSECVIIAFSHTKLGVYLLLRTTIEVDINLGG